MKKFFSLLTCLLLVCNIFVHPVAAMEIAESEQIVVSQSVENLGNGCYFIETIYTPAVQSRSAKTGTKVAEYITSGQTIFTVSVTGTFTYDGSSSDATSSSCSVATYVQSATITGKRAYTSGASACGFGSVSYNGATLQKTVTLTCDKNGNLS